MIPVRGPVAFRWNIFPAGVSVQVTSKVHTMAQLGAVGKLVGKLSD